MSEQDTGAQSGTEETAQSGQETTADGAQSGAKPVETTEAVVSRADYDALRERMRAADQRAAKNEQELRQIRDKDLPELDRVKKEAEEAAQRVAKLEGSLTQARIENAFLKDNKYKWRDPAAAMKLVDLSGVDIGDDGAVTGLKEALATLAKTYPFMLEEEKKEAEETPPPNASAPPMNGKAGSDNKSKSELRRRFPALGTRT